MNKRMISFILGTLLILEAVILLLPALVALIYAERAGWYYLFTALGAALAGLALRLISRPTRKTIYARDGLLCVALGWVVLSLAGALPFTLCGDIPSYLDAVFEMVSGFTTTGSSILPNVEVLNRCSLFWRSFSHWIGGMGILVFMLAIVNMEGGQGIHLLRAESPGPTVSKMVPRMVDSSKILYGIYFGLTVIQMIFYLAGGMPLFDTLCNAFATAGTGGFAIKADSFAGYSYYHQTVTTVFMALFGVNFSIYFFILRRKFDLVWKNTELRWYLAIIFLSIAAITLNILPMYPRACDALHHAAFSVSSVITTTGFGTENFGLWPEFSRVILVLLMLIGACAGSTGGGIKTTTFFVLLSGIYSAATNHSERAFHSAIPKDAFRKASVISMLAVFLVMTASYLMLIFDPQLSLRDVLFEMISAFSTSGLSTGITSQLSAQSRILSIIMMYIGRLGPMTVATLWYFSRGERARYPEGNISIG